MNTEAFIHLTSAEIKATISAMGPKDTPDKKRIALYLLSELDRREVLNRAQVLKFKGEQKC